MPIGLFLCAWPIILAWAIAARKAQSPEPAPVERKERH
jgi:hypothetical protein